MKERRILASKKLLVLLFVYTLSFLILAYDLIKFLLGTVLMMVFFTCNLVVFSLIEVWALVFGQDLPILIKVKKILSSLVEWANRLRYPYKKDYCAIKDSKKNQ